MAYPLTPYQITVWKLSGRDDAVESKTECYAESEWQCIELFDMLTRGIRGHYRAWIVDMRDSRTVRESSVCYNSIGN